MKYQDILDLVKGNTPAENIKKARASDDFLRWEYTIPPLWRCRGVTQNKYHGLNETVYDHLLFSLDASVRWTDNLLLRLAILLHDIGKPTTRTEDDTGIHFYKHDVVGASIGYQWMKSIGAPPRDCEYISWAIRWHMFRVDEEAGLKVVRKFLRKVGPNWNDLIILRLSDRAGNLANKDKPIMTHLLDNLIYKIEEVIEIGGPIFENDLVISKQDILELGIPPNKMDEAIEKVWSCILNRRECNTKKWLSNFLRKNYGLYPA